MACDQVPSGWTQMCGSFDAGGTTVPPQTPATASGSYLALGGYHVPGGIPDAETVNQLKSGANCVNVDFDMEGALDGKFSEVNTWPRNSVATSRSRCLPALRIRSARSRTLSAL